MPKSAFGVDLAMNCATTNAYILKLTLMITKTLHTHLEQGYSVLRVYRY